MKMQFNFLRFSPAQEIRFNQNFTLHEMNLFSFVDNELNRSDSVLMAFSEITISFDLMNFLFSSAFALIAGDTSSSNKKIRAWKAIKLRFHRLRALRNSALAKC